MPPSLFRETRFIDKATASGMELEKIYDHEVSGSSLRFFSLLDRGKSFDDASLAIGRDYNGETTDDLKILESSLGCDAKRRVLAIFMDAISKMNIIRMMVERSFSINSEVIKLSLIDELNIKGKEKRAQEVHKISSDDFSRIVSYVRERLFAQSRMADLDF